MTCKCVNGWKHQDKFQLVFKNGNKSSESESESESETQRDIIWIVKFSSHGGWVVPTSVWRVMSLDGIAWRVISLGGSASG